MAEHSCPLCGGTIRADAPAVFDVEGGLVVGNGHVASLTKQEAALFEPLWANRPRMYSKEQLLDAVYGLLPEADVAEIKIIEVFVCNIRRKLRATGVEIQTVWARGYRCVPAGTDPDAASAAAHHGSASLAAVEPGGAS